MSSGQLYDEVLRRFPEITPYLCKGDEELPYVFVRYISLWLESIADPSLDADIVQRVVDFDRWCMQQPRGESAGDDIWTILVVAFREKLFEHDNLLPLVPKILSKQDVLNNRQYLIDWVGADRYEAALRLYPLS